MSKSKSKKKSPDLPKNKIRKSWFAENKQDLLPLACVLGFTLILYIKSLNNGWTNWDDDVYVMENIHLLHHNWLALVSKPFSLNFHPLTMLTLGLDHVIWGSNPFGFHLSNLLFHLMATSLVFVFIRKLAPRRSWFTATFTALVFAIHPMHVESVAWISERKDVLYMTFFMAGLISYLRYVKKQESKYILFAFLFFLMSVLSKAMAVVFPIILILLDWYMKRPFNKRAWLEKIPFLIVSVIFGMLAVRIQSQGAIAQLDIITMTQRITFGCYGFIMYLVKAIIPFQLSAFYPYPFVYEAESALYYTMPVWSIALFSAAILLQKKSRTFTFGILFYAVTIALVLQFLSVGKAIMADRYTYLPYVGIFFIIGFYLDFYLVKSRRIWMYLASGIFVLAMSLITFNQISVWKDSETLWTQVIQEFPDKAGDAHGNRGNYLGKKGRIDEAMNDGQKALSIDSTNAKAYALIGNLFAQKGNYNQAIANFSAAIKFDPKDYNHYQNRAVSFAILNQFTNAESDFNQAIELAKGENQEIYTNRGIMYLNQGKFDAAIADCMHCQKIVPTSPANNYCLAQSLFKQGRLDEARTYAVRARKFGYQLPVELVRGLGH
jgi:tetratricopeptide (TPR) repeat protein